MSYAKHEMSGAWNMLISEHCVYPPHFRQDGPSPCLCISGLSGTASMQRTEVLYGPTTSCLLQTERNMDCMVVYMRSTFRRNVAKFLLI
jgi:hypothetical protein